MDGRWQRLKQRSKMTQIKSLKWLLCPHAPTKGRYSITRNRQTCADSGRHIGLSQICSKICPKCFWEFPKILPIMLFMLPIMLVLCSNMNNIDIKFLLLECSIRVRYKIGLLDSIYSFQCILNVLLECIEPFNTVQYILYAPIVLLESIDLI